MGKLIVDGSFLGIQKFLEENCSIVSTNGKRYFFLPYWLEEKVDNPDRPYSVNVNFVMHDFKNLPQDLQDAIKDGRENIIFQIEDGI